MPSAIATTKEGNGVPSVSVTTHETAKGKQGERRQHGRGWSVFQETLKLL